MARNPNIVCDEIRPTLGNERSNWRDAIGILAIFSAFVLVCCAVIALVGNWFDIASALAWGGFTFAFVAFVLHRRI